MERKQNSSRYINVSEKRFFPIIDRLDTNNAIFHLDSASIHTSKLTKDWFKTKNIEVLDWPSKSPDLNPLENLCRIFSSVRKNKRQWENRETLKSCIQQYWNEIPSENHRIFIDSIQNKSVEVLQLKGNKCKYWIFYNFTVKYKFSILSYTYFHMQKRIFHELFWDGNLLWNRICILIPIRSRYHKQIFREICAVLRKFLTFFIGCLILISVTVWYTYIYIYIYIYICVCVCVCVCVSIYRYIYLSIPHNEQDLKQDLFKAKFNKYSGTSCHINAK